MKLSLFLILPLLAVAFASEDFDEAIEEDLDEGERELYHLGHQPYYYTPYYKTSNYHGRTSTYRGGSKCRKRKKRCCKCVDSCSSSSSDEEKKCIRKDCKDKCKKAGEKCYGSKKKWKVSARCLQNDMRDALQIYLTSPFLPCYQFFSSQYIRDRC